MKKTSRSRRSTKPPKPPKLRCFFGIEFTLNQQLAPLLDELKQLAEEADVELRISPAENLHITLKFLGSVLVSQLSDFESIMQQLGPKHEPMQLRCRGIGFFKNSLWIGIEQEAALTALAGELDSACALAGIASEHRAFVPHVTVARFNSNARPKLLNLIEKFSDTQWGEISAQQARLYRSDTLADGARYSIIGSYKLGNQPGGDSAAEADGELDREPGGESEKSPDKGLDDGPDKGLDKADK